MDLRPKETQAPTQQDITWSVQGLQGNMIKLLVSTPKNMVENSTYFTPTTILCIHMCIYVMYKYKYV